MALLVPLGDCADTKERSSIIHTSSNKILGNYFPHPTALQWRTLQNATAEFYERVVFENHVLVGGSEFFISRKSARATRKKFFISITPPQSDVPYYACNINHLFIFLRRLDKLPNVPSKCSDKLFFWWRGSSVKRDLFVPFR